MRVLLAMLGARRRYLVPEVMEELGVLACFITDTYVGKRRWLQIVARLGRLLHIKTFQSIGGRNSPRICARRVVAFQWLGIRYAIFGRFFRIGDARLFASVNQRFCVKAIPYLRYSDICWAYNGAAQELFEVAKEKNIRCILEQVIAPRTDEFRELVRAQQDWPEWISPEDSSRMVVADPLSNRERAEWRLADTIVVGSRYVEQCLEGAGVPRSRCAIVPSGIDLDQFRVGMAAQDGRPLRVLFVGQINLRKGVPYLLEAVRRLNTSQIQLKLIGSVQVKCECVRGFGQWASFIGPVPLTEIAAHYQQADILVVPSICEGSAMVTYEARACGVPIIATPNAGAFFSPGVDGLEIPVRNVDAIMKVLDRLVRNRDEVRNLREGAIAKRSSLGREAYRERLRNVLEAVCGQTKVRCTASTI